MTPFTIATNSIKYLGVTLTKQVKDLYNKDFRSLKKEIEKDLRKLSMALLEDPAVSLLDINPEDSPACNKDTCSTMFIAALFVVARSWKEPRCPSTEEWISGDAEKGKSFEM